MAKKLRIPSLSNYVKHIIQPTPPPKITIKKIAFQIPLPTSEEKTDPEDQNMHKIEELIRQNLDFKDQDGMDTTDLFLPGEGKEVPQVIVSKEPAPGDFIVPDEQPAPINLEE